MRGKLESMGTKLAFVFMESPELAATFFAPYGLADCLMFSDPEQILYYTFDLGQATYAQMLNPSTLGRFFTAMGSGHGVAISETDMHQMPGSFLFEKGKILKSYRHKAVSDRPDYCELATV